MSFGTSLDNLKNKTESVAANLCVSASVKNLFRAVFLVAVLVNLSGELQAQTWLINFNSTNGYRGASQTNADSNGNIWNNVNPSSWSALTNTTGSASGSFRGNLSGSTANVDSYNGPLGTNTANPLTQAQIDSVVVDSAALGVLGGSKAAAAGYAVTTSGSSHQWKFLVGCGQHKSDLRCLLLWCSTLWRHFRLLCF